jgi:multidrug resistance efflux pump
MGNLVNQVKSQYEGQISDLKGRIVTQQGVVSTAKSAMDAAYKKWKDYEAATKAYMTSMDGGSYSATVLMSMQQTLNQMWKNTGNLKLDYEKKRDLYNIEVKELSDLKTELSTLEADYRKALDKAIADEQALAVNQTITDPTFQQIEADKEVALAEAEASASNTNKIIMFAGFVIILAVVSYVVIKKL